MDDVRELVISYLINTNRSFEHEMLSVDGLELDVLSADKELTIYIRNKEHKVKVPDKDGYIWFGFTKEGEKLVFRIKTTSVQQLFKHTFAKPVDDVFFIDVSPQGLNSINTYSFGSDISISFIENY